MPRYDLTTFGEGQLRLSSPPGSRLTNTPSLRLNAAGSEANVSGVLAQLGWNTAWASVLPQTSLAERFLSEYRAVGVDLSHVSRVSEGRMALYYLESASAPLSGQVIYDRESTPIRDIRIDDVDWESLLDTRVAFVTGITAALTPATQAAVQHFARRAVELGVPVALDVNHRTKLWSAELAQDTLGPIARNARIVFCSRVDAARVFGVEGRGDEVCLQLREMWQVPVVVTTDGAAATHLADDAGVHTIEATRVEVLDRPGAGDSLVAGVLHGWLSGDIRRGLSWGVRAAALALTHYGDLLRLSADDLDEELGDVRR